MTRRYTQRDVSEIVRRRVNKLNDKISDLETEIEQMKLEIETEGDRDYGELHGSYGTKGKH